MYRQRHKQKKRWRVVLPVLVLLVLIAGYVTWALLRPLGTFQPTALPLHSAKTDSKLKWPAVGQSAVGIVGSSILETHGAQTPAATASTAKVITALLVLQAKPLTTGQQGPTITLNASDVALYNRYAANDGSVVPVVNGEPISEYQMLQALMLPSANNMADSLAIWAYGSLGAYATAANAYLAQHGLTDTHVGSDASGFAPDTTSTAHDLVALGLLAMQHPVLSQIVGQATADGIPLAGTVKNVNFLLGSHNITGIKTGNTDEAGGVFLSASRTTVNNRAVVIVTALMQAQDLYSALAYSVPLIESAQANFQPVSITEAGATVGHYKTPWGADVPAIAAKSNPLTNWNDSVLPAVVKLQPVKPGTSARTPVGQIVVPASGITDKQAVPVVLAESLSKPTTLWRLQHPFK